VRALLFSLALLGCSSRPPALHRDPQALAYRSHTKVKDSDAKIIAAEAVGAARRRPAWNEPLHVHGSDGPIGDGQPKYLFGEARLFLVEYETEPGRFREVLPAEDALMAYADAQFAMQQLARWAKQHGVAWDVQLGKQRGRVGEDGPDANAQEILAGLSRRAGPPAATLEAERARLDAKYRDRR
jgi:hypothetical protein